MADTKEESIGSTGDANIGGSGSRGSLLARPRLVAVASSTGDLLNKPLSTGSFHVDTSNIFNSTKSVLRPSQLKAPFLSSNPFGRVSDNNDSSKPTSSNNPFLSSTNSTSFNAAASSSEANDTEVNSTTDKNVEDAPKFVPLHSSRDSISFAGGTASRASPSGLTRASGFVFGQNLQDRIVKQSDEESGEGPSSSTSSSEHPATNGTSDLLFSAAVRASADSQSTKEESSGTLAESAEAWERARDAPQPLAQPSGPIFTGEEEETNVLQVNCRLFAFEGGIWKERGRGQLRLNDGVSSSRLVCRAAGSLRVLLNTKIFADMKEEKAGSKSLRVTATDSKQQLKVFLIMASPEEINQLHKYLSRRVALAKKSEELCDTRAPSVPDSTADAPLSLAVPKSSETSVAVDNSSMDNMENPSEQEDMIVSQSLANPVVVVSTEDDDESNSRGAAKRPFTSSEEDGEEAKKLCTNSVNNVSQL